MYLTNIKPKEPFYFAYGYGIFIFLHDKEKITTES